MTEIRPIRPDEWTQAKQILYRVAHVAFEERLPFDEYVAYHEAQGDLKDMEGIQKNYFEKGGVFLVIVDGNEIIGIGAIRQLEDKICELRRLWLLFEYQGRGLGYRLVMELLQAARELGYEKIRLETAPVHLKRASVLYKR